MSRLDNKSFNQPVNMLLTPTLSTLGGGITSKTFDTAAYDAGYTIILSTRGTTGGTSFSFDILTSDEPLTGFTIVPNSQLVGGNINVIFEGGDPDPGKIAMSRGVLSSKRYVRVQLSLITGGNTANACVVLLGSTKVSPPNIPEFTQVDIT